MFTRWSKAFMIKPLKCTAPSYARLVDYKEYLYGAKFGSQLQVYRLGLRY